MGQLNPEAYMTYQTFARQHVAQREIARLPAVTEGGALQELADGGGAVDGRSA